jgi:hypothetical protein
MFAFRHSNREPAAKSDQANVHAASASRRRRYTERMRLCLFCQKGRLTREHVWAQWLTKQLKAELFRVVTESPSTPSITRITKELDMKARAVCKTCNGGWMSALESAVKGLLAPMISDRSLRTVLSSDHQTLLATWASKSAMVLEHASPRAKKIYTFDQRHYLKENRRPPRGIAVCLASYNGTRRLHSTLKNLSAATGDRVQTTTVAIDRIILQVTAGPWPTDRPHRVISGEQRRWEASVVDIWPIQRREVAWPPLQRITDEDLYAFADRFEKGVQLVSPEA